MRSPAGNKIAVEAFGSIVVLIDFDSHMERSIAATLRLAGRHTTLHLIHVAADGDTVQVAALYERLRVQATERLGRTCLLSETVTCTSWSR